MRSVIGCSSHGSRNYLRNRCSGRLFPSPRSGWGRGPCGRRSRGRFRGRGGCLRTSFPRSCRWTRARSWGLLRVIPALCPARAGPPTQQCGPAMSGTASTRRQRPREVAHALLDAVLRDRRPLDEALAGSAGFSALSERDRALVRHLTATTLRRLGQIDALLAGFVERPLPDRAASARNALRLGAADILFLRTPAHAAVNEAVGLLRTPAARRYRGLANAVLRRLARESGALPREQDAAAAQHAGLALAELGGSLWRGHRALGGGGSFGRASARHHRRVGAGRVGPPARSRNPADREPAARAGTGRDPSGLPRGRLVGAGRGGGAPRPRAARGPGRSGGCRSLRGAGRQDRSAGFRGGAGDGARHFARAPRTAQGEPGPAPADGGTRGGGPPSLDACRTVRRGAARCALLGHRDDPAASRHRAQTRRRTTWRAWPRSSERCSTRRRKRCGRAAGWSMPSVPSSPRKGPRRWMRSSPPRRTSAGFPSRQGKSPESRIS